MLTRFTPPQHRNLMFSVKQAGVPLGGMIGGLALPPLIEAMGWRLAAVVVAFACIGVTLADLAVPVPHRSAAAKNACGANGRSA